MSSECFQLGSFRVSLAISTVLRWWRSWLQGSFKARLFYFPVKLFCKEVANFQPIFPIPFPPLFLLFLSRPQFVSMGPPPCLTSTLPSRIPQTKKKLSPILSPDRNRQHFPGTKKKLLVGVTVTGSSRVVFNFCGTLHYPFRTELRIAGNLSPRLSWAAPKFPPNVLLQVPQGSRCFPSVYFLGSSLALTACTFA